MTITEPTTISLPTTDMDTAVAEFRVIFARLAEGAGERDVEHWHPYDGVTALARAGFGRLRVPASHGGFDVDLPTLFGLLAEAGEADTNLPQIWRGHFTTTEILRQETDQAARDRWLTAINTGAVFGNAQSEPANLAAQSREVGGWAKPTSRVHVDEQGRRVVSGTKFYSTGARFADYIRAAVVDEDGRKQFVVVPARHPGVTHVDDWDGVGQRETGSGTTLFDEVPVEDDGEVGHFAESLRGLDSFVQIVHLANLAGIARCVLTETAELVRGRARTSLHALSTDARSDPEVLGVVGTLYARRLVADTVLRQAAEALQAAHADGAEETYAQAYRTTSAAQIAAIEAVLDATARAFDAGGSSAVRRSVHLDRHWRNARTLASHNPVIYKPRVIGDYVVNHASPVPGYYADKPTRSAAPDESSDTSSDENRETHR